MAYPSPVLPNTIAVVSRIDNGYVLTRLPRVEGDMMGAQVYCKDELAVGQALLNLVAEENLK